MRAELLRQARAALDAANREPGHSPVEDALIDALTLLLAWAEEQRTDEVDDADMLLAAYMSNPARAELAALGGEIWW